MAGEHIVRSFDEDLNRLDNMIVEMGGLAEMQMSQAIEALVRRDVTLAEAVASGDVRIARWTSSRSRFWPGGSRWRPTSAW